MDVARHLENMARAIPALVGFDKDGMMIPWQTDIGNSIDSIRHFANKDATLVLLVQMWEKYKAQRMGVKTHLGGKKQA